MCNIRKERETMFKKICLIILLLIVCSCIERDFEEIKDIPKIEINEKEGKDLIKRSDFAYYFGHQKGHNSIQTKIPKDITILLLDSQYQTVDYFYFLKFNNWFKKILFENGIMPIGQNETNDCDNYAMLYKSLFSVASYSSGSKIELAVGLVIVNQRNEFGGIPSGGLHMLNIVFANKNFYIFEPQTGKFIELDKYPNQEHILHIII